MRIQVIAFIISFFLGVTAEADFLAPEWKNALHLVTKSEPAFPYTRLKRRGGVPVVLLHGIGGNHHNWMDFAPALYKMGYDVWAFKWAVRGAGDLDKLASEVLPRFLKQVQREAGEKPFLVGHSLGGIISKIFLLGLRRDAAGDYVVLKEEKKKAAQLVRGFVSLASPNGRNNESLSYFLPIFENIPTTRVYGTGDLTRTIKKDHLAFETALVKTLEFNTLGMRLPVLDRLMNVIFYLPYHDYSDYNVGSILRFGFSPIPRGVKRQIRELGEDIRQNPDQILLSKVFFEEKRPVPFAYVAAESDPIASAVAIYEEARTQSSSFLLLKKAGHLDPLFGDMSIETLLFINRFILETKAN